MNHLHSNIWQSAYWVLRSNYTAAWTNEERNLGAANSTWKTHATSFQLITVTAVWNVVNCFFRSTKQIRTKLTVGWWGQPGCLSFYVWKFITRFSPSVVHLPQCRWPFKFVTEKNRNEMNVFVKEQIFFKIFFQKMCCFAAWLWIVRPFDGGDFLKEIWQSRPKWKSFSSGVW